MEDLAMDVKKTLQKNGLTLFSFAEMLNISRPTLNSYIRIFEAGSNIPNEKYQIIFEELFNYNLPKKEFEKKLNKYRNLVQRDKSMGLLELEADATDLFTSVMRNIKKDFFSGNYDENIYIFINMLISSYKSEERFLHLVKYFLVLNDVIPYQKIDFQNESYLLHYFAMFEDDKKNNLQYDTRLEKKFINRIEEIRSIKRESENQSKQNLINLLNEEINKYRDIGIELSEEEILKILLTKIKKD